MAGPYNYYLGPVPWITADDESYYAPPAGTVGWVDLGSIPAQSVGGSDRPMGFFAVLPFAPLGQEYDLLDTGDLREIHATVGMQSVFESLIGYRPEGPRLVDLLFDALANGDPDGQDRCKPLMPTTRSQMELHLGGHSLVKRDGFAWGGQYTARVQAVLHRDFRRLKADLESEAAEERRLAQRLTGSWASIVASSNATNVRHRGRLQAWRAAGLTPAQAREALDRRADRLAEHDRRVLDYWREKYRLPGEEWKQLLPQEMRNSHPGPLPHETEAFDDFNRANSPGDLGSSSEGWSWANVSFTYNLTANEARSVTGGVQARVRAEIDLSSSDMYAQATIDNQNSLSDRHYSVAARYSSSSDDCYLGGLRVGSAPNDSVRIQSVSAGVLTVLDTTSFAGYVTDGLLRLTADASTQSIAYEGSDIVSITNTAHTLGTRAGMAARSSNISSGQDNFRAGDLDLGSTVDGVGSSSGSATVTGVGAALFSAAGSAAGVAAASGVGSALFSAVGTAAGVATAVGVGDVATPVHATSFPPLAGPSTRFRRLAGPNTRLVELSGPSTRFRPLEGS